MASHEHAAADDTCLTPTTPVVPVPAPLVRFAFVDALRGMAAMCILVFHLWWYEPHPQSALNSTHWTMDQAFLRLRGGVQILLVISGFVIAYTLRKTWFTRSEVISFIGRRLVRLVPAYWVTLLSVILIDEVCERLLHLESPVADPLSFVRIAAHMAFLQDVLNLEAMSAGIWTLCIEMQFYVVAIIGWGLAQRLFSRPDARLPQPSS